MTTVLDRLRAKKRRRVVVPVQVEPAGDVDLEEVAGLQADILTAVRAADQSAIGPLSDRVDSIRRRSQVDVAFSALDPADFEKVAAVYPSRDGDDGGIDWQSALPVLAALCAEDESLQDETAWRDMLDSGTWTHGEKVALWGALLQLNVSAPAGYFPKG